MITAHAAAPHLLFSRIVFARIACDAASKSQSICDLMDAVAFGGRRRADEHRCQADARGTDNELHVRLGSYPSAPRKERALHHSEKMRTLGTPGRSPVAASAHISMDGPTSASVASTA
jgi:hypothetical protein